MSITYTFEMADDKSHARVLFEGNEIGSVRHDVGKGFVFYQAGHFYHIITTTFWEEFNEWCSGWFIQHPWDRSNK